MPPVRPMLDEIELQQVQQITVDEEQMLGQHGIPALDGDFLQRLERRAARIAISGVLTGPEVRDGLEKLREKFRAAQPVPFAADIATATRVDTMLIEELGVSELAGKPERFAYALTLREFIPPPAPESEQMLQVDAAARTEAGDMVSNQIDAIANQKATLEVQVELSAGDDFQGIVVIVEGTDTDGEAFSARSSEQVNGTYRFVDIPAGNYIVRMELQ